MNNPKNVYFKLIELYRYDNKFDLILELQKHMIKKFKKSAKCAIEYLKNLLLYKKHLESEKKETASLNIKEQL